MANKKHFSAGNIKNGKPFFGNRKIATQNVDHDVVGIGNVYCMILVLFIPTQFSLVTIVTYCVNLASTFKAVVRQKRDIGKLFSYIF